MESACLPAAKGQAPSSLALSSNAKESEGAPLQLSDQQEKGQVRTKNLVTRKVSKSAVTDELETPKEKISRYRRELQTVDFPHCGGKGSLKKVQLDTACKYLDMALEVIEHFPMMAVKIKWMDDISQFISHKIELALRNKKQNALLVPLIQRTHTQLQNTFELMSAELVQSLTEGLLPKGLPPQGSEQNKSLMDLAGKLSDLDPKVSGYHDQFKTAWIAKKYYEELDARHSMPLSIFQSRNTNVHICRLYLMVICLKAPQEVIDMIPEVSCVVEKASGWLEEFKRHHDVVSESLFNAMIYLINSAENPSSRINLNGAEVACLYFRMARSKCKVAGDKIPEVNPAYLNRGAHLSVGQSNQVIAYQDRKRGQKIEIDEAREYARKAREYGIDLDKQAELHFHFVNTMEIIDNLSAALFHMKLGARSGRSGMHHLYLASSLNINTAVYPVNPGGALREWLAAQRCQQGSYQGLPTVGLGFYTQGEAREFVDLLSQKEMHSFHTASKTDKALACTLLLMGEGQYQEAFQKLGPLQEEFDVAYVLAGYCLEQMATLENDYVLRALYCYENAYEEEIESAGLDYGRLAVAQKQQPEKAKEYLLEAAAFFRENDLYDELEECQSLLATISTGESNEVKEKVPKAAVRVEIQNSKKKRKKGKKSQSKVISPQMPSQVTTTVSYSSPSGTVASDHATELVTVVEPRSVESFTGSVSTSGQEDISSQSSEIDLEGLQSRHTLVLAPPISVSGTIRSDAGRELLQKQLQVLDDANAAIRCFSFDEAEDLLESVEPGENRRLKGRFAQMKGWCLRRRYICNDPGKHGQLTLRGTMLGLLKIARGNIETGIRCMGITGALSQSPLENGCILEHFSSGELRTLSSLYAELGHIHRERSGFTFSTKDFELGRKMSNFADQLNSDRSIRALASALVPQPKIRTITQEDAERQRAAIKS